LKKLVALVVVILVLGVAGNGVYGWYQGQINTAAGSGADPVKFSITPGESADQIAADLQAQGLIKNQTVFLLYVRVTGARAKFEAGDYELRKNMTMAQIVQVLEHAVANQMQIKFLEGWTIHQMGVWLEHNTKIGTAQQFVDASKGSWSFDFLGSRPAGADLQGYLFPDTYNVDENASVHDVIQTQLTEFGRVFTPQWRAAIKQATAARPAESIENIVILASIVQLEANVDMPKACSVYYNRLSANMALQVDATILFAEGRTGTISDQDRQLDSPYNTFLHAGLPPGPIGNPGAQALAACVNPPKTNFFYYFTDRQGKTHFEATLDQFNADVSQYGVKGT
jgi:peptidoglycan lytic transglycosylase G